MMTARNNFYDNDINMERVEEAINYLASNLTLNEVLKVVREISYDMVSYYDEDCCARIYKNEKFSKINQEQACRIQRLLSSACDLFGQSVINGREFEEGYLEKWTDGGSLQLRIDRLKNKIEELENEIEYLKEEKNV